MLKGLDVAAGLAGASSSELSESELEESSFLAGVF